MNAKDEGTALKYMARVDELNETDLNDLNKLLCIEDEILHRWYFDKVDNKIIPNNKFSILLKKFKL